MLQSTRGLEEVLCTTGEEWRSGIPRSFERDLYTDLTDIFSVVHRTEITENGREESWFRVKISKMHILHTLRSKLLIVPIVSNANIPF